MTGPAPVSGGGAANDVERRLAQRVEAARRRLAGTSETLSAERGTQDGHYPMSSAQERFWIAHELDPTGVAFSAPIVLHVEGPLDVDAWADAVDSVVAHHDVLRTSYEVDADGRPVPVVRSATVGCVRRHDHRGPDSDQRARAHLGALLQERFDLTGPAVLADVLAVADDDHLVVLRMHHTNTDGTSRAVLLDEIAVSYAEHSLGAPGGGPAGTRTYERFARGQRSLSAAEREAASHYLSRVVELVSLDIRAPGDRDRSELAFREGRAVSRPVSRVTLDRLAGEGPRGRTTTFIVLLTTYQLLISEWTGAGHFPVAFPVAGRVDAEHERALGCFINTVVVPAVVDPQRSFRQQLAVVDRWLLDALEHQVVPIEHAVAGIDSLRGDRGRRLGRFWMDMRPWAPVPAFPGLTVTELPVVPSPAADLSLVVDESEDTVMVTFEFSPDLLDDGTVERLADRYIQIVEQAAALGEAGSPEAPVDDRLLRVVARFAEILGSRCHADTDFFAAGGSSLDAFVLLHRVAGDLERHAEPGLIFTCPTPRLLLPRILSSPSSP